MDTPDLWGQIISALVTILLALLVPLALKGVQWILVKVKLDQNAMVQLAVRQGIAYAEEAAAKKLREEGLKLTSKAKLGLATASLLEKVPGIDQAEAEKLVHEQLAQVGLGAAGFLSAAGTAIKQ